MTSLALAAAGSGALWAHTDPTNPNATKTGVGHSFGVFSDAGCTVPIVGVPILECQTIFLQATLSALPHPPNAAFEAGSWVMVGPDGQIADLGSPPCVGGTLDDPNSANNNGRGLCLGAPASVTSLCVSYTPTAADITNGSILFQSIYGDPNPQSPDTGFSHIGSGDLAGASSSLTQFVTIDLCDGPPTDCLMAETCDPGPPASCVQEPQPISTACETDQDLCTNEHCDGNGECIVEGTVQCATGACFTEACDPGTGECVRTCVPGDPDSNPECWVQVGDFIWDDGQLDGNGVQDPGEPGLPGIDVEVLDCNTGGSLGSLTTDGGGLYGLALEAIDGQCLPISFDVQIQVDLADVPAGWIATEQNSSNGTEATDSDCDASGLSDCFSGITAGDSEQRIDCGFYDPVSVELQTFSVE